MYVHYHIVSIIIHNTELTCSTLFPHILESEYTHVYTTFAATTYIYRYCSLLINVPLVISILYLYSSSFQ